MNFSRESTESDNVSLKVNHLRDVAFERVYLFRSRKQQQQKKSVENNFAPSRSEKKKCLQGITGVQKLFKVSAET